MKLRFFGAILGLVVAALFSTSAYAAWNFNVGTATIQTIQPVVTTWFFEGPDVAHIDNVSNCSYLTPSAEEELFSPAGSDGEAVRFTNTGGSSSKAHSFILRLERTYTVGEIKHWKVAFDYYYAQKREQAGRGFPKLQLMYNTTTRGSDQGGTDLMNDKSPWLCTDIGEGWWHLEYFITAMVPTMTAYQDKPVSESLTVNGFKITDGTIFDYHSNIAFIVVDNARFIQTLSPRLGLFNRTTSFAAGTYYWFKVCWSGEYTSVILTVDDDAVAEYAPAETSPFYVKGLSAGQVTVTATFTFGDGSVLSISNRITVT